MSNNSGNNSANINTEEQDERENDSANSSNEIATPILPPNIVVKNPRIIKSLSENKLKRLNILTFINEKKEILFTKKAYKFEKERIWRQTFKMMLEYGMVSAEKDWRYVRDVSFSNWRKRAQKRLKHLNANGHQLNMDECEFLISDILGQTPDKVNGRVVNFSKLQQGVAALNNLGRGGGGGEEEDNMEEEESDEDMIDSDEDDGDVEDDEVLMFVPTVVMTTNDNGFQNGSIIKNENENDSPIVMDSNHRTNHIQQINFHSYSRLPNDQQSNTTTIPVQTNSKHNGHVNNKSITNNNQTNTKPTTMTMITSNQMSQNNSHSSNNNTLQRFGMKRTATSNLISGSINQNGQETNHHSIKSNETRLFELELENRILKNRYMKLKVFKLEQSLGFEHCKEVQDLMQRFNVTIGKCVH